MDADELKARIREAYDCDEETAGRIADQASQYEAEVETGHTAEEWVSFMRDSEQDRAVLAWNWAVGYDDPSGWKDGNPYKLDP